MSQEIAFPSAARGMTQRTAGAGALALPGTAAPLYGPGRLSFRPAVDPEKAWGLLGAATRDRVNQRAGEVVEWWAWTSPVGLPHAVVLGADALVSATPTISARGRPAHLVEAVRLRPGSARTVAVTQKTAGRPGPSQVSAAGRAGPVGSTVGLPADLRDFLGHLPGRAQQLLQEPFLPAAEPPSSDYHYLRTAAPSGFGCKTLQVLCYLYDRNWLTSVAGTAVAYGAAFDVAQWDLVCRRVAVLPR